MPLKRFDGAKEHGTVSALANAIDANKYENEKRMKKGLHRVGVAAKGRGAGFGRLSYKGSANRGRTAGDVARQQRW